MTNDATVARLAAIREKCEGTGLEFRTATDRRNSYIIRRSDGDMYLGFHIDQIAIAERFLAVLDPGPVVAVRASETDARYCHYRCILFRNCPYQSLDRDARMRGPDCPIHTRPSNNHQAHIVWFPKAEKERTDEKAD